MSRLSTPQKIAIVSVIVLIGVAAVLVPLITIGKLGIEKSEDSRKNEEVLNNLVTARNELTDIKLKLKTILNDPTNQVNSLNNVTRRKREEPPARPDPSASPAPQAPPAPQASPAPQAPPASADEQVQPSPTSLPAFVASSTVTQQQSQSETTINNNNNLTTSSSQPATSTAVNVAAVLTEVSSVHAWSGDIQATLEQLSLVESKVLSHSTADIGNLTEIIVKLQHNSDIIGNNSIEKTEDNLNQIRSLLNLVEEAETKIEVAINQLESDKAVRVTTTSTPADTGQTEEPVTEGSRLSGINGTLIRLEGILQNLIAKAADSSNITNSSSDNLLSEIKADVEKQLDLVSAASQHEDSVGAGGDAAALASARADLDTAISKLVTIQTLGAGKTSEIKQLTDKIDNLQGALSL